MKKIVSVMVAAFLVMLMTGCGVNIKQEGNKIYTDVSKDEAYAFTGAALKTKGYKVTEESKINYYIVATPEFNKTFQVDKADKQEVKTVITASTEKNETVVTILASAQGNIDQKESERIANEAVQEIIAELNKYGKFTATKDATQTYPVATVTRVNDYVRAYFADNKLAVQETTENFAYVATQSDNPFNDALKATVVVNTDETKKVTVKVAADIKGNYDIDGSKATVEQFVQKINDYLSQYPVAEKGSRHAFQYITLEKAFGLAKAAIQEAGYTVSDIDAKQLVINAKKDTVNLVVTLTTLNNNRAINLEAYAEGAVGETKDVLSVKLETELAKIVAILGTYQTSVTGEKTFISSNQNDVVKYIELSLKKLSYGFVTNAAEQTVLATSKSDANRMHAITINNLGGNGISVSIVSLYNAKSAQAKAIATAENKKLINALNEYDGKDMK